MSVVTGHEENRHSVKRTPGKGNLRKEVANSFGVSETVERKSPRKRGYAPDKIDWTRGGGGAGPVPRYKAMLLTLMSKRRKDAA